MEIFKIRKKNGHILRKFSLPRLNQQEIEIINNPNTEALGLFWKTPLKLELWSKISQTTKAQDQMASQESSIKHLEKS